MVHFAQEKSKKEVCKVDNLEMWQEAINMIVSAGAVSLPLAVVSGLVGRAYNALVGMVTGEKRVRL